MALFPFFANLEDKAVLVVGGGVIAERKIRLLRKSGARITVRSPRFTQAVRALGAHDDVTLSEGVFEPALLDGVWLIVAATNIRDLNAGIARHAAERGIFVNVVDDPVLSTVQTPAIIDRQPLMIGISSAGSAPMVARAVREMVETVLDDGMGRLAGLAQEYRARIQQAWPDMAERRAFYTWLLKSPILAMVREQRWTAARAAMDAALASGRSTAPAGRVVLVPTFSDDPGMLTLHALRALNQADLVVHARALDEGGLPELARRDAARTVWTSQAGQTPEDAIDACIVQPALDGGCVVVFVTQELPSCDAMQARCRAHAVDVTILPAADPRGFSGVPEALDDTATSISRAERIYP